MPTFYSLQGRLLSIVARERTTNFPKESLDRVIEASNQDIRQCINTLQLLASGGGGTTKEAANGAIQRKDITVVSEWMNGEKIQIYTKFSRTYSRQPVKFSRRRLRCSTNSTCTSPTTP
jgi:DNA polymerase III delta prime subunit